LRYWSIPRTLLALSFWLLTCYFNLIKTYRPLGLPQTSNWRKRCKRCLFVRTELLFWGHKKECATVDQVHRKMLYLLDLFFLNGSTAPWGPRPPHFSRIHDHTF
jgi:hypothetical protein